MLRLILCLILFTATSMAFSKTIEKIAFGSCFKQNKSQKLFQEVAKNNIDLWIWGGDNIYADTYSPDYMRMIYAKQKNNDYYKAFLKSGNFPVIGTWDDHDYGMNDDGKENPIKKQAQQLFLDFLNIPKHSNLRKRLGIYNSHTYGEAGKQVKIIILDTRYHRDPFNSNGDILGEEQWSWLKEQLINNSSQLTIIVSSIQFIADEHIIEKWANFPKAKKRFLDLLKETKSKNFFFISGDRHRGEISLLRKSDNPFNFPVYDLTSSGFTHTTKKGPNEINNQRVGDPVFRKLNFGLIVLDWKKNSVQVDLQIRGKKNKILHSQSTTLQI